MADINVIKHYLMENKNNKEEPPEYEKPGKTFSFTAAFNIKEAPLNDFGHIFGLSFLQGLT